MFLSGKNDRQGVGRDVTGEICRGDTSTEALRWEAEQSFTAVRQSPGVTGVSLTPLGRALPPCTELFPTWIGFDPALDWTFLQAQ